MEITVEAIPRDEKLIFRVRAWNEGKIVLERYDDYILDALKDLENALKGVEGI